MGQSRSSVLLQERSGASGDILHTNPHLVGRSHPVSVDMRKFDCEIKEEGSVSASSDQGHSTQHPEDHNWRTIDFRVYFPFKGEVKAKIKISPVVVFGVLSRMVLVRGS